MTELELVGFPVWFEEKCKVADVGDGDALQLASFLGRELEMCDAPTTACHLLSNVGNEIRDIGTEGQDGPVCDINLASTSSGPDADSASSSRCVQQRLDIAVGNSSIKLDTQGYAGFVKSLQCIRRVTVACKLVVVTRPAINWATECGDNLLDLSLTINLPNLSMESRVLLDGYKVLVNHLFCLGRCSVGRDVEEARLAIMGSIQRITLPFANCFL